MAQIIKTSQIDASLKETLDVVMTDEMNQKLFWESLGFKVTSTTDNWVDDQEYAGTGLAQATPEGGNIPLDAVVQGGSKRYKMVKYALGFVVSEEAIADCKYEKAINDTENLGRSMKWTQEYIAVSHFINSFSTSFPGGLDNLSLCNTAHTTPKGPTFSNQLATAMSLSETAVETMRQAMRKLPSYNGLTRGFMMKRLIVPVELEPRAYRILKSEGQNDTANNATNFLRTQGIEIVANPFLTSATNWWGGTDAPNGMRWIWRLKPQFRKHNIDDNYAVRCNGVMRFDSGWSDPRGVFGSNI
jgi:hypothetical protein